MVGVIFVVVGTTAYVYARLCMCMNACIHARACGGHVECLYV